MLVPDFLCFYEVIRDIIFQLISRFVMVITYFYSLILNAIFNFVFANPFEMRWGFSHLCHFGLHFWRLERKCEYLRYARAEKAFRLLYFRKPTKGVCRFTTNWLLGMRSIELLEQAGDSSDASMDPFKGRTTDAVNKFCELFDNSWNVKCCQEGYSALFVKFKG